MTKPRLLDLFCGAGGAAVGYHRAGFEVVGVDIEPQPHYPFEFHQADALEVLALLADPEPEEHYEDWLPATFLIHRFDAIHASPPCQAYTDLRHMWPDREYPNQIPPTRDGLSLLDVPWVMENVERAPLLRASSLFGGHGIRLCGTTFGLGTGDAELRRHRLFESNFVLRPAACRHRRRLLTISVIGHGGTAYQRSRVIGVYGGHGRDRRRTSNTQDFSTDERREAMGIDWMTGEELSQAIPPAYTEFIGSQLIEHLARVA